MGLFQAVSGAIGGTLADQWLDFFGVPDGLPATAAVFPAVRKGENAGRGSNDSASDGIITNGSKIVVPEGYGLVLIEDGAFTGFAAQPGGYVWDSEESASKSVFSGGGLVDSADQAELGALQVRRPPGSQQTAFFVALKELPNNKFGTQSEIYWDDAFLNTQVGAITRGTYTLKITDPLTFIRNFVSADVINGRRRLRLHRHRQPRRRAALQRGRRVARAGLLDVHERPRQGEPDQRGSSRTPSASRSRLSAAVEENYRWRTDRGLEIVKTAIISIEYDENTRELLKNVQRADALSGSRGNSNLQASVAAGIESAGENAGPGGVIGMGMAAGGMGLGGLQQPSRAGPRRRRPQRPPQPAAPAAPAADDPVAVLKRAKEMLDAGLITQEDYDAAKAKALGL